MIHLGSILIFYVCFYVLNKKPNNSILFKQSELPTVVLITLSFMYLYPIFLYENDETLNYMLQKNMPVN